MMAKMGARMAGGIAAIALMIGGAMSAEGNLSVEARELLAKAEAGDPAAQNTVGFAYQNGLRGLPKNPGEGMKWLLKAAAQNHGAAQNNLCTIYAEALDVIKGVRPPPGQKLGELVPVTGKREDAENLMKWCALAAEKNFVSAQSALGYFFGKGMKADDGATIPPDYAKSFFWIGKPVGRGGPTPFAEAIAAKLTPQQREAISQEFIKWEAAHSGRK